MLGRRMFGCTLLLALTIAPMRGAAPETFGAGVSLSDVTPIAQVIDRPADFEGRTVRVEGVVTAVCAHMGCWMALAPEGSADASRTLLLKVDDGVIVFPMSARGRRVAAQGVVQRVGSDAEGQSAADEHARAAGSGAAAAPVAWQLKATGAVLH